MPFKFNLQRYTLVAALDGAGRDNAAAKDSAWWGLNPVFDP